MTFEEYKQRMKEEYIKLGIDPQILPFPTDEELIISFLGHVVMFTFQKEDLEKEIRRMG